MAKHNGGAVDVGDDTYELFSFLDQSDRKRLIRTCSSICRETESNRKWEHFPKHLIVIGHNGMGDLLVFIPMEDAPSVLQHSVYWYDHETSETHLVADDFDELT